MLELLLSALAGAAGFGVAAYRMRSAGETAREAIVRALGGGGPRKPPPV